MISNIWISYDLGATGDYEGMYAWLDDRGAIECGSSVAFIKNYDHGSELLTSALRRDIEAAVNLGKRSRIYVILGVRDDNDSLSTKGRFLIGGRKGAPPWDGYGQQDETADDEA